MDLPQISGAEAVHALERAGFVFRSQRGSHRKLRHPDGRTAIVPMHR
jgi:predicted RNA binding protein YcfA (HicA-like mRNA interferase family)